MTVFDEKKQKRAIATVLDVDGSLKYYDIDNKVLGVLGAGTV